jgi:glycosyltransferase involved in cell wall biosynthesis
MRVGIAVPSIDSYLAFLDELGRALEARGDEVHVFAGPRWITAKDSHPEVPALWTEWRLPRGLQLWRLWRARKQFAHAARSIGLDIVSVHFGMAAGALASGVRFSVPWLATLQGLSFPLARGWRRWFWRQVERRISMRACCTVVLSEDDEVQLKRLSPKARVVCQQSPGFGCRLDRFDPKRYDAAAQATIRRQLGIPVGAPVVIFVGRQVAFKGFPLVMRTFAQLRGEFPTIHLLLVGAKDPLHPSGLPLSEEASIRAGGRIVDVGWASNVDRYLAVADLNLFPSRREGMPVNLMESLAMGVPVVTSAVRGCRHVVRAGKDGVLLDPDVPHRWPVAVARLLRDPPELRRLSLEALTGRERFDRRRFVAEHIALLDHLRAETPT